MTTIADQPGLSRSLRSRVGRYLGTRDIAAALRPDVLGAGSTLLDVGCGSGSPLGMLRGELTHSVGVDAFPPSIAKSRALGLHHEYVREDVMRIGERFAPRSFDVVAALDLIEHLTKEDGYRLLDAMESVARRRVIVFTPNGFLNQEPYDGNEYQRHLSGWEVEEMEARGYRVRGFGGWKPLRGGYARMRFRPAKLWEVVSHFTQPFAHPRPRYAFQLICVKDVA